MVFQSCMHIISPAKFIFVVSHSLHAAGGSNGTFEQASTNLDVNISANDSERFSTVVYYNITQQTKVYYHSKEIVDATDIMLYSCCRWKHYHKITHCQSQPKALE